MSRRRLAGAAAGALLLSGCGGSSLTPAQQAERCEDFAAAVAKAGLSGTPSEQVAADVGGSLDNRLSRIGGPAVHGPAVQLHQQLHAIELAHKRHDQARADQAAERAREAIERLAAACDLPPARFLGSS